MSKGLRLSFFGIKCTVTEVKVMTHTLGYTSEPVWNGWGARYDRNFIGYSKDSCSEEPRACKTLVEKGLMVRGKHKTWSPDTDYYHLTTSGKKWLTAFKRLHPHADWKQKK